MATSKSVLLMRDAAQFVGARAKFQRLRDMKILNGWIRSFSRTQITVQFRSLKSHIAPGDKFSIEIAGKENTAASVGEATLVNGANVTIAIRQDIQLLPKIENVRFWMYGVTCELEVDGSLHMTRTIDVAERGLSVLSMVRFDKGSLVEFRLESSGIEITGAGEVQYCRVDPLSPNQFRTGIQLLPLNRIQQARWDRLVQTANEAA